MGTTPATVHYLFKDYEAVGEWNTDYNIAAETLETALERYALKHPEQFNPHWIAELKQKYQK